VRVLVACEYSATVRDAFRALGHDAWSCDLLPTDGDPRWHILGDVLSCQGPAFGGHDTSARMLEMDWDLLIAHPPCTDLSVSGARHFAAKIADGRQQRALDFVQRLMDAPIEHIAIENPISVISSKIRKPDQIIQPWQFGHGETKATCLWLKNLPKLLPTDVVEGREQKMFRLPPSPDRWKLRSKTYQGIANAMAAQWGGYAL